MITDNNFMLDMVFSIKLGSEYDICTTCTAERAKEEKKSFIEARQELRGKYTGRAFFRVPESRDSYGSMTLICQKCLRKYAQAMEGYSSESSSS